MEPVEDWKKSVGFTINYSPGMSDDDFDVVMRHPRQSDILLADGGDGSEADSLGTTPPRERIRNKKKYKYKMNLDTAASVLVEGRRPKDDNAFFENMVPERPRSNRLSLTIQRSRARDWKQDMSLRDHKADSLPSPNPQPAVPTLVESCSRFMSLTSRLKCPANDGTTRDEDEAGGEEAVELRTEGGELAARRVSFHKTFSMLINMGSVDKGCRRTISREEQVWQNELKDLIWLELQAKIAGRTLAEQDAFLCVQRNIVPAIVHNIRNYVFVSPTPCRNRTRRLGVIEGSTEDLRGDSGTEGDIEISEFGCLSFNCQACTEAIGKALREVGTLLDSFYNAGALYPSSHGMCVDHPLIATQLFKHRLKAMCLWYNTALHLRLKILAVRRMIRSLKIKAKRRQYRHLASTESDVSRQSLESHRPCQVRFNVSNTPTDSSNSDSSAPGDPKDIPDHSKPKPNDMAKSDSGSNSPGSINPGQNDPGSNEPGKSEEEISSHEEKTEERGDEVDGSCDSKKFEQNGPTTPEIVIDSKYGTSDTVTSSESGYTSSLDDVTRQTEDVFDIGSLEDLVQLRLLNKCAVSIYRSYHYEILKTQGVRRCMQFMNKMRCNLLQKVHLTFEKPDDAKSESMANAEEDPVEVFDDTKEEEHKTDGVQDEEAKKAYELRRYGCWSEECVAMRLPSYRAHFLLLSSVCLEAAHDYLSLRLEDRPRNPSCLTVKQLIHELKEGLDIATEMRAAYARNIEVALQGQAVGHAARNDLLLIIRTFDATVETVVKQYLSYLRTMSEVEQMGRGGLQTEWAFTARLARRVKCAALLAPVTFSEIAVNQLNRLHKQFEQKFDQVIELEKSTIDPDKHFLYALCRAVQQVYASEREAALQAAQWARALAARLARAPPPAYHTQRQDIFESLMRIRDLIVEQTQLILSRSQTPPAALDEASRDFTEAVGARIRELMLQIYRLGFEIHKELHRFVNPPSNRRSVQASPPRVRPRFNRQESTGDDNETNIFDDKLFENINSYGENQTSIELLLTGELPRLEDTVDLRHSHAAPHVSEQERQWATRVARAVVEFAKCWMLFVIERCDTGRGLRPRWASQGLEFLMLACDPCNTKHLTEEEFEDLKKKMDLCISHVIGSRPAPRAAESCGHTNEHRRRPRLHSPLPSTREGPDSGRCVPAPPTPPLAPDPLLNFPGLDTSAHSARVLAAVEELERSRDQQLREKKAVGYVVAGSVASYEPKLRQLKFKWQRGLKIGAGTFGKVYTVVNTESGQLLAMKELSIGAGDRRALQRAANELRVLEGVIHPHLVRYYGCELHREEMLIFMELCVEGSLEALIATSGALAEHTTRRYTRQLLAAVSELHARAIAHRDIKSGNIFLTNEGHCLKLGDFGCAVKIRANTTAAGELIGHVGTQAYMAPEVFMKSTGHGRAADIWSLGCVVTEMASGKRPFSEYDSNVQIMFVVGMGGRPSVPDSLSLEGQEFCLACLTHEPERRPRAEVLGLHHFLKIKADDEDCNCEPAYLISPPRSKN